MPVLGFKALPGTVGRPVRGKPLRRHVFAVHRTTNATPLLQDALAAACDLVAGEHLTCAV